MSDFSISEEMQKLVQKNGDDVAIHTADCIIWKAEHENCAGCPYELGCGKVVYLMLVMMNPIRYEPKGYADYAKMQNRIQELMDKILHAKSIKELKVVPIH